MPTNSLHGKSRQVTFFLTLLLFSSIFPVCVQSKPDKQDDTASAQKKSNSVTAPSGSAKSEGTQLIVYYFMSNFRCPSCIYIEKTTESVVNDVFADQIKSGRIVFKAVNIDKPGNKHYDTDYKLYAQSVILSEVRDGKELRWTNLDKIWKLLNNDAEFKAYVTKEIKTYLGES